MEVGVEGCRENWLQFRDSCLAGEWRTVCRNPLLWVL